MAGYNHAREWKAWRKKNLMSQAHMAAALGLSRRTVQGIEWAEHAPSYTSQRRFKVLKDRYARAARQLEDIA